MKKLIFILALLMPVLSYSQSSTDYDNWIYEGDITITECRIPDGVRKIREYAFEDCKSLKTIIIPKSVSEIDEDAFRGGVVELQSFQVDSGNQYFSSIDGVLFNYDKTKLIKCPPEKKSFTIPASTTSIEKYAFENSSISSIEIPENVSEIVDRAFLNAYIETLSIGTGVKKIVVEAFWGCRELQSFQVDSGNKYFSSIDGVLFNYDKTKLIKCPPQKNSFTIPTSTTSIEVFAFDKSSISSIEIPENVSEIVDNTFNYAKIKTISIGTGVKKIGVEAFWGCRELQSFQVDSGNKYFSSIDGVLFNYDKTKLIKCPPQKKSFTIPTSTTTLAESAFINSSITSIVIPSNISEICDDCFRGSNLQKITFENGVRRIGKCAFGGSEIDSISIPESVKVIDDEAFWRCRKLKSISLQEGVETIGEEAIANENLQSVTIAPSNQSFCVKDSILYDREQKRILFFPKYREGNFEIPNSVESFDNYAFYKCSLSKIIISDNVKTIGEHAFEECKNLDTVIIGNRVETIGSDAFYRCKNLRYVKFGDSIRNIGNRAFWGCDTLESANLGKNVEKIGDYAFAFCYNLISVTLPNSLKVIRNKAFFRCYKLEKIIIPDKVSDICASTFAECVNLSSVSIGNGVKWIGQGAFYHCKNLTSIHLPNSVKEIGSGDLLVWYQYNDGYMDDYSHHGGAFEGCCNLKSINIPDSIQKIGDMAFAHCSKLKKISLGKLITSIGERAFFSCNITEINIPNSVKNIGDGAFGWCNNLKSIHIPNGVEYLGDDAFKRCDNLASITIPGTIQKIPDNLFCNLQKLKKVSIGNGVKMIGDSAFKNCRMLISVNLPESVSKIGKYAFFGCESLKEINIPKNVSVIRESCFEQCSNLTSVTIPENIDTIKGCAFSTCYKLQKFIVDKNNTAFSTIDGVLFSHDKTKLVCCPNRINYIIPYGTKNIGLYSFQGCKDMKSVTIPNSVEVIEEGAFSFCNGLTNIVIPGSVHTIEHAAFWNSENLKSVIISDSIRTIEPRTFYKCRNLISITIPQNVKKIDRQAFARCSNLKYVTIGPNVERIESGAFEKCTNLKAIAIPQNLKQIAPDAFDNLTSITGTDTTTDTQLLLYQQMMNVHSITERYDSLQYYANKITDILKQNKLGSFIYFNSYISLSDYYDRTGCYEEMKDNSLEGYNLLITHINKIKESSPEDTFAIKKYTNISSKLLLQIADAYISQKCYKEADSVLRIFNPSYDPKFHIVDDKPNSIYWFYLIQKIYRELCTKEIFDVSFDDIFDKVPNYNISFFFYYSSKFGENSRYLLKAYECYLKNTRETGNESVIYNLYKYSLYHNNIHNTEVYTNIGKCYTHYGLPDSAYVYYSKAFQNEFQHLKDNFVFMNSYQRNNYWQRHKDVFENTTTYDIIWGNAEDTISPSKTAYNSLLVSKGLILASEQSLTDAIMKSKNEPLINDFFKLKTYRIQLDTIKNEKSRDSLRTIANRLETDLMKRSSQFADLVAYMNVDWQKVRKALGKNDVAIEFFYDKDCRYDEEYGPYALVLKKNFDFPRVVDLACSKLPSTTEIYNKIWKPLEQYLSPKGKVYFSPDGALYNIAIEYASIDSTHTISDKYKIYRISSTRNLALKKSKKTQSSKNKVGAVFGGIEYNFGKGDWQDLKEYSGNIQVAFRDVPLIEDTTLRSGVSYLAGSKLEYEAVSKILKDANYQLVEKTTGITATEELFKKLSGQGISNMLISTHGFYQPKDTVVSNSYEKEDISLSQSGLLLAGANSALDPQKRANIPEGVDDGILTAKEISRMDLKGLDLVVLSACQTGLGEVTSEGVFGLQRGFKKAGANTIVMSLWKVDDNATKDLMTEFYKNLVSGKSKRDAFLAAQEVVRRKYPDPKYWAAFIIVDGME